MGGNALKNTFTRRYQRGEYIDLRDRLIEIIRPWSGGRAEDVRAIHNKDSFGDMDLLVERVDDRDIISQIIENLKPKEYVKNGTVFSFECEELQIDLLFTPTEIWETSRTYFAWNDASNLIGRIAKKMCLKYGHKGLSMPLRDGSHMFKEVQISTDPKSILEFLGYDYEAFDRGFDELDDMFEFVASSQYFDPEIFLLDNRNHKSRVRDAKRPNYRAFLKWCETWEGEAYGWASKKTKGFYANENASTRGQYEEHLQRAFDYFPEFEERYKEAWRELEDHKLYKEKFNGAIVSEITGAEGKKLGAIMQSIIKNSDFDDKRAGKSPQECRELADKNKEEFKRMILRMSEEEIRQMIVERSSTMAKAERTGIQIQKKSEKCIIKNA